MQDYQPRVLIVDDEIDIARMFEMFFQRAGFATKTVHAARAAIALAEAEEFDIVFSDIGMPGMNGYELAAILRRLPNYRHTPMYAVTGYSMYDDRERALRAGFNDHLVKPVSAQTLNNLIARWKESL
ncbi:MAG: response regulator [Pyrinomonadaceae bacterium]